MRLVECVPNFSEGRRADVIAAIQAAVEDTAGVYVLDQHADSTHNRSVLTFAGEAEPVAQAAFRCVARAAELIDLTEHEGQHPRMGATDVLPFVPLGDTTMAECVALAHRVGRRIGDELEIPVYLYYEAARRPERRWLPSIRRGEFESIREEIGHLAERAPDFGPARLGPAGATAVGARPLLIAFNINLTSSDLGLAREIARLVRQSSGGLRAVQARAMASADQDVVQLSMNLLDYRVTPPHAVYERVRELAAERGVGLGASEVVGLLPGEALAMAAAHYWALPDFAASRVLENRLLAAIGDSTGLT